MTDITLDTSFTNGQYYIIPYGLSFNNSNVYDIILNKFLSYKYLNGLTENFQVYFSLPIEYTNTEGKKKTVYYKCNINQIKNFDNDTYYNTSYSGDTYDNTSTYQDLIVFKKTIIDGSNQWVKLNPQSSESGEGGEGVESSFTPSGTYEKLYKNGDSEAKFELIIYYQSQKDYSWHYKRGFKKYIKFQRTPSLKDWVTPEGRDPEEDSGTYTPIFVYEKYKDSNKIFKNNHPKDPIFKIMAGKDVDTTNYVNDHTYNIIIGVDFSEHKDYVNDIEIITSELDSEKKPIIKSLQYKENEFKVLFKYDSDDEYSEDSSSSYYDIEDIKTIGGNTTLLCNYYWDGEKERFLTYSEPLSIYIKWTDDSGEEFIFKTHENIVLRTNTIIWKGFNLVENKLFYESNDKKSEKYLVEAGFEFNNKNIKPIYVDDYTCIEWDGFKLFFIAEDVYFIDITNISRYDNTLQIFKKFYDKTGKFPTNQALIDNETIAFPLAIDYESKKVPYSRTIKVIQKIEAILWEGFNIQKLNTVDTNEQKILSYKDISNHTESGGGSDTLRLQITKAEIQLKDESGTKIKVPYYKITENIEAGGHFNSSIYMVDDVYIIPIGTIFNKNNVGEFSGDATETEELTPETTEPKTPSGEGGDTPLGKGILFGDGESTPSTTMHKNVNGIEINYGELYYDYCCTNGNNQYRFFDILFKKDDKYVNIEDITTYDNSILNNEDESEEYDVYIKYNYRMFNTNRKLKYIRYIYDIEWLGLNMTHKFINSLSVLNHFKLYNYSETDDDGKPLIEFSDSNNFIYEYDRLKENLLDEYTKEIVYGVDDEEDEEETDETEEEKEDLLIYTDKHTHQLTGELYHYPYYYAQLLQGSKTILSLGLDPFDNTDIPENLIEWRYNIYFYKYEYEDKEITIPGEGDEEDTTIIKQVLVGKGWTDGGEETTPVESESLVAGKGILFGDGEGTPKEEINPDHKFDNAIRLIPSLDKTKCAIIVNYIPKIEHTIQEEIKYPKLDILDKIIELNKEGDAEMIEGGDEDGIGSDGTEPGPVGGDSGDGIGPLSKSIKNKSEILSINDEDDEFIERELTYGAGEGPSIVVDINFDTEGGTNTVYETEKEAGATINIWNIISSYIKTSEYGGSEIDIPNLQNYLKYSATDNWTYLFQVDSDNKGPEFRFIRPDHNPSSEIQGEGDPAYLETTIWVYFTGHSYYKNGSSNFTLKINLKNSNNRYMHFNSSSIYQDIYVSNIYYNELCDFSDSSTPVYNRDITCTYKYRYTEGGVEKIGTSTVNQSYSDYSSHTSRDVLLNSGVFTIEDYSKPSIRIKNSDNTEKIGYIIEKYTGTGSSSTDYCTCASIKKIRIVPKKNNPSITLYNISNLEGSIFSDYSSDGMGLSLVSELNKSYNTSDLVKLIYYNSEEIPHKITKSNLKYDFISVTDTSGESIILGTKNGTFVYPTDPETIKQNYSNFKVKRYGQIQIKVVFLGDEYNNATSATITFNIILKPVLKDRFKADKTKCSPGQPGATFTEDQFGYILSGILTEDESKIKLIYKIPEVTEDLTSDPIVLNPQNYIKFNNPTLETDTGGLYEREFTENDTITVIKYPTDSDSGYEKMEMTLPIQCQFTGYSEGGKLLYTSLGLVNKNIYFSQQVDLTKPIEDLKEELGETIGEIQSNIYGLTSELKLGLGTLTEGVTESIMKSVIKKPEPKTIKVPIPLYVEVIAQIKDEYLNTAGEVKIGAKTIKTSPYYCEDDTSRQKYIKRFIFTLKALDDNEYAVQEEFPSNEHTDLIEIENYIVYNFNDGKPLYKIKVGTDLMDSKFDIYGKLINNLTLFADDGIFGKQVPFYLNTDKPERAFDLYYECNGDFNELIDCKYLTDKDLYSEKDGEPLDGSENHAGIYYNKQFPIYIKYNYRFFKTKFEVEFISTLYDFEKDKNPNNFIFDGITIVSEHSIPDGHIIDDDD